MTAGVEVSEGDTHSIAAQPWMTAPQTRAVIEALGNAGIAARFVGGCVRDALLGRPIADVDIATPGRPEAVIAALEKAQIKAVPTGIEHGTVTAVVDSPEPPRHFEITSLRRDVETYVRRARVAFDADWAEDAARRDFTINAIYLDPDGTVHDPVGRLGDLEAHRVRFVGAPAPRNLGRSIRPVTHALSASPCTGSAQSATAIWRCSSLPTVQYPNPASANCSRSRHRGNRPAFR